MLFSQKSDVNSQSIGENFLEKVSIIIPVYNVALYLRECLDSVVNQTYRDLEIILVDDGSTDGSETICDEYARKDGRFLVIHQQNAGAANAKNTGLDNVTGSYVAFLDSDDFVSENWIETMIMALKKYDSDIAECGFDKVLTDRTEMDICFSKMQQFSIEEYMKQYVSHWDSALFFNKIFSSSLIQNIRFRTERRCIDDEFFTYKVISNGSRVVRVNDVLYHYRQRKSSAVHAKENSLQKTDDYLEMMVERFRWITKQFPTLKREYLKHDVDTFYYFSKSLVFDEPLIKKYKKTARFYLSQSIIPPADRITLYYSVKSAFLTSKCFNRKLSIQTFSNDNLFK